MLKYATAIIKIQYNFTVKSNLQFSPSTLLCLKSSTTTPQGCTNATCQVTVVTKLCMVAPNICQFSSWKFLYGAFLASRILGWLLDLGQLVQDN